MKKRTFLITGASKGIGRALSERLSSAGHKVVGIARGSDPGFPGELVSIDFDDTRRAKHALADLARADSFDGLVNNVGLARLAALGQIDLAEADELFRLNVHSAILGAQAILPAMREQG